MIVCVVGPTGVGKTKLAEELSVKYDALVVNCDAMQVYKYMDIGTAKYTPSEDAGQPHLLFDLVEADEMFTVYDYQKALRKVLSENEGRNVILVGGTGLYLKAGLYDYEFNERCEYNDFDDKTNEELYELIRKKSLTQEVHINNRRRMISKLNSTSNSSRKDELLYEEVYIIGLTTDRKTLYDKIDARVDKMISLGLLREVETLYRKYGLTKAMKTGIGYKELIAYLEGKMTLDEAIRLIKQKSRKYAKRQYTWFNNQMNTKWFQTDYDDFEKTIQEIVQYIEIIKKEK